MYVPNYVPEPEQIPGSVTKEPYADRLQFIRRVLYRFVGSVGFIVGVGLLIPRDLPLLPGVATIGLLVTLLLISAIRSLLRGTDLEPRLTSYTLPIVIIAFAFATRSWTVHDFPAWSILAGISCFGIYSLVCGRDFSFVGGFTLSLIVSSVLIAFVMVEEGIPTHSSAMALIWNAGGLFYLVYDLAAMLSRRKPSEGWAAVVDLYRDVLNFIGYFPRVLIHWNRHRILNDLSIDNPFRN
jgi:hypothetical protein